MAEKTGPARQGKPRRKPAGAPKAAGRTPASKSRRSTARTKPARPAAGTRSRTPASRSQREAPPRNSPPARGVNGWLDLVMTLVQAPVGLGRVQAERLVGELVKTGNLGQREAERLLNEVRGASERAQGRAASAADGLDRFVDSRIEVVLNRVNIPSRSDIERLNKSVDVLTAKVEALLGRHERGGQ